MTNPGTGLVTLKTINNFTLWIFVTVDVLIFIWIIFGNPLELISKYKEYFSLIPGAGIAYIALANAIFSRSVKSKLVFWRWNNPEPGCRAFSKLAIEDRHQIDIEELKNKLGDLPNEPVKENLLWFKLYKQHQENLIVKSSHKAYLLYRDFTAITLLIFLTIIPIGIYLEITKHQYILLFSIVAFQYLIANITAINKGKQFVKNVLVIESQDSE